MRQIPTLGTIEEKEMHAIIMGIGLLSQGGSSMWC